MIGLAMLRQDREVARRARAVRVGDDSASVLASLGPPAVRCEPGDLGHLRASFPPETPRPTAEETLLRLRHYTASRWVWGKHAGCVPREGDTEVGFTRGGLVFWAVAEHGNGPATLP